MTNSLLTFQDIDTTCTELTDAGEQALLGLTGRQVIVTTNKNLQVELDQVCCVRYIYVLS